MGTITVKGVGRVLARPDYVELSLSLRSVDMEYEKAMDMADGKIDQLTDALVAAGFKKDDLKTTDFNIGTEERNVRDKYGDSRREFAGFAVRHRLKICFDFDTGRLAKALSAVAGCTAEPNLSVNFTVKDQQAVSDELLRSACENARQKAEILCAASGVKMGQLLSINYNWGELNIYSRTDYSINEDCMSPKMLSKAMAIEPDDIDVSDSASFVWEIS